MTQHTILRFGRRSTSVVVATVALAALLGACGSEQIQPDPTSSAPRGWLDDPPRDDEVAGVAEDVADLSAAAGTAEAAGDRTVGPVASEAATPPIDGVAPVPDAGPLQAGSVDDNERFGDFLDYLDRTSELGIPRRVLDPAGRIVIRVVDDAGTSVAGAPVRVSSRGTPVATLVSTSGGRTLFHPHAYGEPADEYTVDAGGAAVTAEPGVSIDVVAAPPASSGALDVSFVLDATGSMGDEIDRLKSSVSSIAARIRDIPGVSQLRLSLTAYRDEGDAYVTSTYDFTDRVDDFRTALDAVTANGGGDTPEALDEALGDALTKPAWSDPGAATQIVFLVTDAGEHPERDVPQPYTDSMRLAAERGVKIFPIAASASDDQAEVVLRQIAQFTGARFVFLSYGAGGAATGEHSDIESVDYEELSLDDLVVRLITEEFADRGPVNPEDPTTTVPNTSTTTTSIPPGQ